MNKWKYEKRRTWIKLFFTLLCINGIDLMAGENITRSSRNFRTGAIPQSRFVSFDALQDKIGIDLDLTIPFLSVPLNPDLGLSLININAKALTIAGIFISVSTLLIPFLFPSDTTVPLYRSADNHPNWSNYGETMNQVFLDNPYLGPCMKKFICSTISKARRSEDQTSIDKIIDGISSHEWFNQMMEGTAIKDAIVTGRQSESDCNAKYSECFLSRKLNKNFQESTFV